jgi:catechol 2,3-dioxygenase-like lactoylglutathione lyase family enzyme
MNISEVRNNDAISDASVARVDMKLEVVVIPVSDVDRAKEFYGQLGWRLDADFPFDNGFRVVQFTPPGSGCSVQFGTNMTSAAPGSAHALYEGREEFIRKAKAATCLAELPFMTEGIKDTIGRGMEWGQRNSLAE